MFGISGVSSVVGNKEIFFLNFFKIFGKTAMFGVVGSKKKSQRIEEVDRLFKRIYKDNANGKLL